MCGCQAAWLEAEKEAAKRAEAQAAELAAREARLAAQQQVGLLANGAPGLARCALVRQTASHTCAVLLAAWPAAPAALDKIHTGATSATAAGLWHGVRVTTHSSLPARCCMGPCVPQALAEEGARLSVLQEQLSVQQQQLTVAALRGSNGSGSPTAAAAVAARAASLAAREAQLLQQQQELSERERVLAQVGTRAARPTICLV